MGDNWIGHAINVHVTIQVSVSEWLDIVWYDYKANVLANNSVVNVYVAIQMHTMCLCVARHFVVLL